MTRTAKALIYCLTLLLAGCGPTASAPRPVGGHPVTPPAGRHLVGYYAEWDIYGRGYPVRELETSGAADRLTDLVYAFGTVSGGQCAPADSWADYTRRVSAADSVDGVFDSADQALKGAFNQLRKLKKRHPQLKILWSFGGWNGSAGFADAVKDPSAFAKSCRDLVDDPRWSGLFDGIDIDWEYPNACGATCDTSGKQALTRLTTALRTAFGPSELVTAAITGDARTGGTGAAADYTSAAMPLDWVMAMTYDYYGTTGPQGPTAPHSALKPYPGIPQHGTTASETITELTARGIPAKKILLGVGFYGRGWTGVSRQEPGGAATGLASGSTQAGIEDYRTLASDCPATGTVGGTAYAYCGHRWWSYDTPQTIATKVAYARAEGLGGMFCWELSGDTIDGTLVKALTTGWI